MARRAAQPPGPPDGPHLPIPGRFITLNVSLVFFPRGRSLPMNQPPSAAPSPPGAMPSRGYLICCIERTGSNLLTEALSHTGIAGHPAEYFNPTLQDTPLVRDID